MLQQLVTTMFINCAGCDAKASINSVTHSLTNVGLRTSQIRISDITNTFQLQIS